MRRRAVVLSCLLLSLPLVVRAQSAPMAAPARERAGFATDRLVRIDALLERYVAEHRIAGAVGMVLRDGRVVYEKAAGWADQEAGRRMALNTIFRIASQTKAITSVAVLSLVEEGTIGLGDPVSRFIPAFASTTVSVPGDKGPAIVPAKRAVTIQDLLTHTAGISYGTDPRVAPLYRAMGLGPAAGWGWYTADKNEPICDTMERLATLPFVAQPGETFVYGYNTDILGCVVERASGKTLDAFIRERITGPLGMHDTHFFLPPAERSRLAAVYRSDSAGKYERAPDGPRGQGDYVDGPRRSFAGGAGIVSTAHDYARFLQMVLNDGELDGVRVLAPHTVALMRTNQVGTRFSTDGMGFGLGFDTVERYGASGMASVGSFGWGGAYGSTYRVDPKERLVIVFMMQLMPNSTDIQPKFSALIYQALVKANN